MQGDWHAPITPNLWFDAQGHEAAEFYVSVFPNSKVTDVSHYTEAGPGEAGTVLTVEFELDGQPYTAINGGPSSRSTRRSRSCINCADQAEVDHYWEKLTDGGEETSAAGSRTASACRGRSSPPVDEHVQRPRPRPGRARHAGDARMKKLDIAALQAAADTAA